MRKRKNQYRQKHTAQPHIPIPNKLLFTIPQVRIMKDSLRYFEIMVNAHEHKPLPNIALAELTFTTLKQKLIDMLEREEWEKEQPFDYNEIWILYCCVAMYVVDLQLHKELDQAAIPVCLSLCNQFRATIESHK